MEFTSTLFRNLVRHILLQSSYCKNQSLLNGKMGIALFFYHLGKVSELRHYTEYANELLEDIYQHINSVSDYNFANGLSGIAWGIHYLLQKGFVQGDEEEILMDMDKKILESDVRHMEDLSLEYGLGGLAFYQICRYTTRNSIPYPYDLQYIMELYDSICKQEDSPLFLPYLKKQLHAILQQQRIQSNISFLNEIISCSFSEEEIFNEKRPIGILCNGYTGIGFKLLFNHAKEQ
ncbi:MAG: hypothetical protein LIP06_05700 [Tannerellaceae bacterium]|nr:hypothetical protein [Tannerellaceae bacterium]